MGTGLSGWGRDYRLMRMDVGCCRNIVRIVSRHAWGGGEKGYGGSRLGMNREPS